MGEKLKISLPIIVEGRYDKSALSGYVDALIITTGGFAVFNNKEKQALIRRIAGQGVIVLTDSDGGGKQIRAYLSSLLPKEKIYHLYVPQIVGKERRKNKASASGFLGVEGMKSDLLIKLLSPFANGVQKRKMTQMLTNVDFFKDKLTGHPNSTVRRDALAKHFDLPAGMSAKALLAALNLICADGEYEKAVEELEIGGSVEG